ncbi:immunoglobulin superfamily member 10-like isoform X2 [Oratosquilla oratoria]|uniref:immunoglobulin superfamily member 10-like isoform X2 n=1 Tax=Oratosquilla oratoria TaxID=337810 RepID=UPI003F7613E3
MVEEDLMLMEEAEGENVALEEVLVVRGQRVTLKCDLRYEEDGVAVEPQGHPMENDLPEAIEVRWLHDGRQIHENLRIAIKTIATSSAEGTHGALQLTHAVASDSGVWQCVGQEQDPPRNHDGGPGPDAPGSSSDEGAASGGFRPKKKEWIGTPVRVVVTIPPEMPFLVYGGAQLAAAARLTTKEGNALTLHCVVNAGNPAPNVKWILAGRDITKGSQVRSEWRPSEGQYYTVSNVTLGRVSKEHHNATLACVVQHPALPVPVPVPLRLNIEYSPSFRLRRWPSWGSPLHEGTPVSLLCIVDANPVSPSSWIKEGADGGTVIGEDGWLNISSASSADRGWYKCSTHHPMGRFASHSVFINVLPSAPPDDAPDRSSSSQGASGGAPDTNDGDDGVENELPSSDDDGGADAEGWGRVEEEVGGGRKVEVGLGQRVRIPCSNSGNVRTPVCWTRHDQADESGSGWQQDSLVLSNTKYSDSGKYRCLSMSPTHQLGDSLYTVQAEDVHVSITGEPVVEASNTTVRLIAGRAMALSALICARPHATKILWLPPSDIPLRVGNMRGRFTAHNLTGSEWPHCHHAVLTVAGVTEAEAGDWVVLAVNSLGMDGAVIRLNVTTVAQSIAVTSASSASSLISFLPFTTASSFFYIMSNPCTNSKLRDVLVMAIFYTILMNYYDYITVDGM